MLPYTATPFLVLVTLLLSAVLAYLEVSWLHRTFRVWSRGRPLLVLALYNFVFLFFPFILLHTYFVLFIFPLPIVPIAYLVGKGLLYLLMISDPRRSRLGLACATLPLHALIAFTVLTTVTLVNPTMENMQKAIETHRPWSLELMLWLGGRWTADLGILVNTAIVSENPHAIKRLFSHGASPDDLYWVNEARSLSTQWLVLKLLLDHGADPNDNAIRFAEYALNYSLDEFRYCLAKGLNPHAYPRLLHQAIERQPLAQPDTMRPEDYQSIIGKLQLLLDYGLDINERDPLFSAPLITALRMGHAMDPVLTFMLARGADLNTRTVGPLYPPQAAPLPPDLTPLMLAIATKNTSHVALLLRHGADTSLRDAEGKTAWDYAAALQGYEDIVSLLRAAVTPPSP